MIAKSQANHSHLAVHKSHFHSLSILLRDIIFKTFQVILHLILQGFISNAFSQFSNLICLISQIIDLIYVIY